MKIDLYTKIVFTVIAVCLALLAVRSFQAAPVVGKVQIIHRVDLWKVGGRYISKDELLNIGKVK